MASPVGFVLAAKRQRKANYADNEIHVLLEEVMLARGVLFGSFSSRITIHEKNVAWDRVTAAVNACGVVRRSRLEVKEKWKTLKSEVIGRQRRANQTGGGPPESPLAYEESVIQILGSDSNLIHGVSAACPSSFPNPSSLSVTSELGGAQNVEPATVEQRISWAPSATHFERSPSFSSGEVTGPMCSSTPLPASSLNESTLTASFGLPVQVGSPVICAQLDDGHITVSAETGARDEPPQVHSSRRSASRRARGPPRLRTRPANDPTSDMEERAAFIQFLNTSSEESIAKIALFNAQTANQVVNATRMKTHTRLMEAQHMRELLEIDKLKQELAKSN